MLIVILLYQTNKYIYCIFNVFIVKKTSINSKSRIYKLLNTRWIVYATCIISYYKGVQYTQGSKDKL